jgi:uncharacterized protein (DUF488 family)
VRVNTIGHGRRPAEELVETLIEAGVQTVVDVRRFPGSRRNPQFGRAALEATLSEAGIGYRHAVELGGRLSGEPGEERFACIRVPAFRSYAARMGTQAWQDALTAALAEPTPCLMCAETLWVKCHRRLIAELLGARGHEVVHLLGIRAGARLKSGTRAVLIAEPHRMWDVAEYREGRLFLCGEPVA